MTFPVFASCLSPRRNTGIMRDFPREEILSELFAERSRKDESCSSRNEVQIKNASSDPRGLSLRRKVKSTDGIILLLLLFPHEPSYWQRGRFIFCPFPPVLT